MKCPALAHGRLPACILPALTLATLLLADSEAPGFGRLFRGRHACPAPCWPPPCTDPVKPAGQGGELPRWALVRQAEEVRRAMLAGDHARVAALTHPALVEKVG